jgi:hypothetical protein
MTEFKSFVASYSDEFPAIVYSLGVGHCNVTV